MSLNEIIILVLTIYGLIGTLCLIGAFLADTPGIGMVFAFFFWPVIAWFRLLMIVERVRNYSA